MKYRVRKTEEQLKDLYKDRDVEAELRYTAEHILKTGYFSMMETDYIRWLCYAALDALEGMK